MIAQHDGHAVVVRGYKFVGLVGEDRKRRHRLALHLARNPAEVAEDVGRAPDLAAGIDPPGYVTRYRRPGAAG